MMKKNVLLLCFILFVFSFTMRVHAHTEVLQDGYTENGIYYQIFEAEDNNSIFASDRAITVSRCFVYEKILTPSRTIKYVEGNFAGELVLQRFFYKDGKTHAYYSGTLTLQE